MHFKPKKKIKKNIEIRIFIYYFHIKISSIWNLSLREKRKSCQ